MCTVTYLPTDDNSFILTSNRDEDPKRKTIPPKVYLENGVKLSFPKDEVAGGTWIGLSEKNRLICLLNGGFENHNKQPSYKISRGVLVKLLLTSDDVLKEIENFDFVNIEPFTIVLVDWNQGLQPYELVWTGVEKSFKKLEKKPHIWSSSTLYTQQMKQLRLDWFSDWLEYQKEFNKQEILKFHQDTTKGNSEISPMMKRATVETISTTCVVKNNDEVTMEYISYV